MWIQEGMPTVYETTTVNPVKRIEITPAYDAVLAENQDRLLSDTGIQLRINRSIPS